MSTSAKRSGTERKWIACAALSLALVTSESAATTRSRHARTAGHASPHVLTAPATTAPAPPTVSKSAPEDTTITLRGGQEGTVFRSLTVEGEDRIHVEIERPELRLALDPEH